MSNRSKLRLNAPEISFSSVLIGLLVLALCFSGLGFVNQSGVKKADVEPPDLPPSLPSGKTFATFNTAELLEPPASMQNVLVAKTPPVVDFLYYPGQDYEGKPWSNCNR